MSRDELVSRLHSCRMPEVWGFSDDAERAEIECPAGLVPAAVLIPLVDRPEGPGVLFIRRSDGLRQHAGQIGFPGGRVEPEDKDAVQAALRETEEEIGVAASEIDVLGRIPVYTTGSGFLIAPVVGWLEPPLALTPNRLEVAEIFELPFALLMDGRNHRLEPTLFHGRWRTCYAIRCQERRIWGATAGMLVSLARQLGVSG